MSKHYEIIINGKSGVVRKGVIGSDIVDAINKAVKSVDGVTAADVDRAVFVGIVDVN